MRFISVLVSIACFSVSVAHSEKIGVIDIVKIEKESSVMKDLKSKEEKARKDLAKVGEEQEKRLKQKRDDLQKAAAALSAEKQEKDFLKLQKEFMLIGGKFEAHERLIEEQKINAISVINDKVKQLSKKLAEEKGYDLIITSVVTMYSSENHDISQDIIAGLNKDLKSVNFAVPPLTITDTEDNSKKVPGKSK